MNRPGPHVMILAGEPSGDYHGGHLIHALRRLEPGLIVSGIGGPQMRARGADLFFPIEKLSAMGLIQVARQFKTIKQAFDLVRHKVTTLKPDVVVLIDYPGFNLRVARFVKTRTAIPVFYYIPPKVWAWNASRLNKIRAWVDHTALILPFEARIYKNTRISATYVGNPLMDEYAHYLPSVQGPSEGAPVIGLLPGSRPSEIQTLMPVLLETAQTLLCRFPGARFLVSAASHPLYDKIRQMMVNLPDPEAFDLVQGRPAQIFKQSHMLIAASGTVTLEAAVCRVPTIIVYRVSPLAFALGKLLVKVKYVGLANLIAGTQVMPELIQHQAAAPEISRAACQMLGSLPEHRRRLAQVRQRLGRPGAPARCARLILKLAGRSRESAAPLKKPLDTDVYLTNEE